MLIKLFAPIITLIWLSVRYVDQPVSRFIQDRLYGNRQWSTLTSSLPDTLLLIVAVISSLAYVGQMYRERRQLFDLHTRLLGFIAISLPAAYGAKTVLKYLTGRIETRLWLQNPRLYEFHWLHGGSGFSGFPSGHMLVFTTLFAAITRYQPVYGRFFIVLSVLLAILLVVTNYHFVGDVICGAYFGLLLEGLMDRFYTRAQCM